MGKTNYQLSPQFELIEDTAFLQSRGYNSTVLWDKEQDELLLLNAVIVDFLKAFQQPTTLDAVVRLFQKGSEDTEKDIKDALKPFFKSMRDRQIIVACKNMEDASKPEMPNGEGLKLGDYTLQKRLTCVPPIDIYVATDENGQKVLLKRLLFAPDFPEKGKLDIRKTFAHEFKMLDILRGCPNICPLIFYDKDADYAVIEFFEGDTLKSLFEQKSPLFLFEQIFILKQVLEAAAFMHSHGVLHGDWHYKNVLINDDNVVKAIDFDLALTVGERQKRGLTKGGIKEFIPPERIDDSAFEVVNAHPDFRSEVFQIGVLAYYLFYGDYPFKGETWKKLAFAIKNDEPDYSKLDFPKEITQFLRKAMAKYKNDRFESAVEMYGFWSNTFV
jgi:eukaryotic-like serine/threonine-protein kinase